MFEFFLVSLLLSLSRFNTLFYVPIVSFEQVSTKKVFFQLKKILVIQRDEEQINVKITNLYLEFPLIASGYSF